MTWVAENPFPIAMIGALGVAIGIGGWLKTGGRREPLYFLVAVVLICGGGLLYERLVTTDAEQVKNTLHMLAAAIERDDLQTVLDNIDEANRERPTVEMMFRRFRVHRVKIKSNLEVEFPGQTPRAKATFNAVAVGGPRSETLGEHRYPQFVIVNFEKRGERWIIIDWELRRPIGHQ
ncbi:MAG: hypothetical protein QGG36_28210 [Pirellulaceae bacterium]|jgi:hypothetical protein|nr:hypothetical protein [Pirellulaceae bacterium]MDP7019714.1 hypothetical protein [Pirellulaceae bacterium]